jgi:protein-S-isoprenylcysteine O-methyltransferase Ste14
MKNLYFRVVRSAVFGLLAMAALLFVPAGTLHYWQAFVFMTIFVGATIAIAVYLAIKDPQLLARRMTVGPTAEKQTSQKIIMSLVLLGFIALLVVPALNRRFMWSPVSPFVSLIGNLLVALGFLLMYFVIRENRYAASTVQVAEGQTVVSTGPYAVVRHPMYAGALPLFIGIPLALGSWSGLFALVLLMPALIWRLLDEEKFLHRNLPGYTEYTLKIRYRLVPLVW